MQPEAVWINEAAELTPEQIQSALEFAGMRVVVDPAIASDEVHILCRDFNGRTGQTDVTRHRIINL